MWESNGATIIKMTEGDYGIRLPFTVNGITLAQGDSIRFTFKNEANGETILVKEYTTFTQNTANLEFTEAESLLFPVGTYAYNMDWYQNGHFMCNLIPVGAFKVVDKA